VSKVAEKSKRQRHNTFCDIVAFMTRFHCHRLVYCCHCNRNIEQHHAKSAMAKATGGHSGPKSGMAMAIAAIPVAPPMSIILRPVCFYRATLCYSAVLAVVMCLSVFVYCVKTAERIQLIFSTEASSDLYRTVL